MKSNIKKNLIYQVFYQFLISVLPFITSPYIARILGADKIGIYSYVYAIVTFFILFSNLGINNYGNRLIAKSRDDKEKLSKNFTSLLIFHVVLASITTVLYILYFLIFDVDNKLIFFIQAIFLFANAIDISWLFFGLEKFKLTVTRNSIVKIITVVLIFIFVKNQNDLWKYTVIMSFGILFSQVTLWTFFRKYTRFTKVTVKECLVHTKPMLILFIAALAVAVYSYTDKIMLGKMSSMDQLGFYENAYKLIDFPVGFITALSTVMLPKISNLVVNNDNETVNKYIGLSMQFSMLTSAIIFFGISAISREFAYLFWGKDFIMSGVILEYLSICIVLISWNTVIRSQYLIPKERDKIYLLAVTISAVVNCIINYLLIPKYGAIGAGIGTIISYALIFLIQNIFVIKKLPLFKYFIKTFPYFIIGIVMNIVINIINYRTEYSIIGLIIKICVGAAIYTVLLCLYAFIFKDEFVLSNMKKIIAWIEKTIFRRKKFFNC